MFLDPRVVTAKGCTKTEVAVATQGLFQRNSVLTFYPSLPNRSGQLVSTKLTGSTEKICETVSQILTAFDAERVGGRWVVTDRRPTVLFDKDRERWARHGGSWEIFHMAVSRAVEANVSRDCLFIASTGLPTSMAVAVSVSVGAKKPSQKRGEMSGVEVSVLADAGCVNDVEERLKREVRPELVTVNPETFPDRIFPSPCRLSEAGAAAIEIKFREAFASADETVIQMPDGHHEFQMPNPFFRSPECVGRYLTTGDEPDIISPVVASTLANRASLRVRLTAQEQVPSRPVKLWCRNITRLGDRFASININCKCHTDAFPGLNV